MQTFCVQEGEKLQEEDAQDLNLLWGNRELTFPSIQPI